jgi:outer membrane receptor protein involved in Fe transport
MNVRSSITVCLLIGSLPFASPSRASAQAAPAQPSAPASDQAPPSTPVAAGGTIKGSVKAGAVPLPGVSVTATNTLTGKKFTTTTDVTGAYEMTIPQNGRYVVRAELSAFALATKEALLNAASREQQADFALVLASRAAAQEQAATRQYGGATGAQALALLGAASDLLQAGSGSANSGAALPSIAANADASNDSVAISGATGTTNPFAAMGDLRQGFENEQQLQALGQNPGQQAGGGGGFFGGGFGGPGGGFGGPGGGGPGGGGRRGGNFRNFKPSQPHGAIFWNGGPSAFNAEPFAVRGQPEQNLGYDTNHYGLTIAGEPFIPKLTKPSSKDFVFLTLAGQHSTTPVSEYGTVPTALERAGNFSQLVGADGATIPIYNPATGQPYPGNTLDTPLSPQAVALLNYIPAPNLPGTTQNYRLLTTQGSNTDNVGVRWNHSFGASTGNMPSFVRQFVNTGNGLNQSLNVNFNYSHSASDDINLFYLLGGKQQTHSYSTAAGYSIGKGKLTNNFTFTWNRNNSQLRNFFTNLDDVSTGVGILGPDGALNSDPANYGLPNFVFNQFTGVNQQQPNFRLTQTFALSESSSWRHGKHNVRFGGDAHRVELNLIGGTNSTGTFYFTGFATQAPGTSNGNQVATSGSSFADFLLGIPQETTIQSPAQQANMRQNTWDLFAQDDWRALPSLTILAGLRYEYFSPYAEKSDRLATLDYNSGFTAVAPVYPNGVGPISGGKYPHTLIYPERDNFSPRLGVAWRPFKDTVVRAGYGINYTVGQYGNFVQNLAYQPPFADVQNNQANLTVAPTASGVCSAPGSLANCFAGAQLPSNYAVNRNYRLPYVQVWNLDIQRTLPLAIVLNVGYNGAKGTRLDVLSAPGIYNNVSATGVQFDFEDSVAFSNFNALAVRANKRLQNGIALQLTYTYSHSIDDASSIGAGSGVVAQNWQNIRAEESNSSFDIRNQAKGTFLYELPFGPDKHYLSSGNWASHAFGDWSLSGSYTLADGTPLTPSISASVADTARGSAGSVRPDRVPGISIRQGGGRIDNWFNTAAFSTSFAPGQYYGTASRNSIPGPGTTVVNMSLSKTFQLKDTKSFEIRMVADNALNIVQYAGVNTQFDSTAVGQVTSAKQMRTITFLARYRF